MSELRDTLAFQEATLRKFEEVDKRDAAQDAEIAKLQKFAAALDRAQKTMDNQIEIFRNAIDDQFDRLRRELGIVRR